MEIRQDLLLVDVNYENEEKKVVLTFLDKERGQIRTVNFNKQIFDNGKYVDDPEKAATVEKKCDDIFGTSFDKLKTAIGVSKDIYCYDRFNSLWECSQIEKFTSDMVGMIIQTEIKEIEVDDIAIRIRYDYEGKTYESKMTFSTYMEAMKQWFEDPLKKEKMYKKFEEKFGVPVDRKDELIGHALMVEVKSAFGSNFYGDVKKFPNVKKK